MQAIHTVVTESGRFFQVRGSSNDQIRQILFVAKASIHENVLDVIDEVRGGKEEDGDDEDEEKHPQIETEHLKKGQYLIEIPQDLEKVKMMGIKMEVLSSRFEKLINRVDQEEEELQPVDIPSVDIPLLEEKPEEEEVFEPEDYIEVDIRPLRDVKLIVGVAETKDHTSLFD